MTDATPQLTALHLIYTTLTNRELPLTFRHLMAWENWLSHKFTADDLRLVITHVKALIKKDRRREESFRFHNLIENVDRFAEDLAEARQAARRPKVNAGKAQVLLATDRSEDTTGGCLKSAGAVVSAFQSNPELAAKALQDFQNMRDNL